MSRTLESKVVLLGSQGVGKTSLVVRYVQGTFTGNVSSTIGASFFPHKMNVDGCRVKLQIWDTAGQERFRSMAPMYYRGASAAMLVYDVGEPRTFSEIQGWVTELERNTDGDNNVFCIVANKVDLRAGLAESEYVSTAEGQEYARSIGALFYETSAKDDTVRKLRRQKRFD